MRGAYEQVSYRKLHNCINNNKSKKREINFIVNHKPIAIFQLQERRTISLRLTIVQKS